MSALNGDTENPGIPPDITWKGEGETVIYACSQWQEHTAECDGNCDSMVINEVACRLVNEGRAWSRLGMEFQGIPSAMAHLPINGIHVELLDLQCLTLAMRDILVENGLTTVEDLDDRWREIKFKKMNAIRKRNEGAVREERLKAMFGIDKPILGPDGRPIG